MFWYVIEALRVLLVSRETIEKSLRNGEAEAFVIGPFVVKIGPASRQLVGYWLPDLTADELDHFAKTNIVPKWNPPVVP